jgi:hypothetical protein
MNTCPSRAVAEEWEKEVCRVNVHGFSATLAPHASRLLRVSPQEDD